MYASIFPVNRIETIVVASCIVVVIVGLFHVLLSMTATSFCHTNTTTTTTLCTNLLLLLLLLLLLMLNSIRCTTLSVSISRPVRVLTLLLEELLFPPTLFIVADLLHKTNDCDHPTRPFYYRSVSLSCRMASLFLSLCVLWILFVFFYFLLLRCIYLYLSLYCVIGSCA